MSALPDWIKAAAEEIDRKNAEGYGLEGDERAGVWIDPGEMAEIIAKHCPMQEGVAYMPVPRCETCRWWTEDLQEGGAPVRRGHCEVLMTTRGTAPDFGCVKWEKCDA